MPGPKLLTLQWHSLLGWGNECVGFLVTLKKQPLLPPWIVVTMQPFDCGKGKIKNCWRFVDAHLNDILTVIGCTTIARKMYIVFIDRQWISSMYNHLHPKGSRPLSFWATTKNDIWAMNDVASSRYSYFGRQLVAYWSIHHFWIYVAWLLHLSSSSSGSSISMISH